MPGQHSTRQTRSKQKPIRFRDTNNNSLSDKRKQNPLVVTDYDALVRTRLQEEESLVPSSQEDSNTFPVLQHLHPNRVVVQNIEQSDNQISNNQSMNNETSEETATSSSNHPLQPIVEALQSSRANTTIDQNTNDRDFSPLEHSYARPTQTI